MGKQKPWQGSKKQTPKRSKFRYVISLLIGVATALIIKPPVMRALFPAPAAQPTRATTKWDPIPFTPVATGTPLAIPAFEEWPKDLNPLDAMKDANSVVSIRLREKLRRILSYHPNDAIREDAFAAIENGELFIELYKTPGLIASFTEVPAAMVLNAADHAARATYPVMMIDVEALAYAREPADLIRIMLVFTHEFIHYRQWGSMSLMVRGTFSPQPATALPSVQDCRQIWEFELQAHAIECTYANAWNVYPSGTEEFCPALENMQAFDQKLFQVMRAWRIGPVAKACIPTWAYLAGHPHPNAFEKKKEE